MYADQATMVLTAMGLCVHPVQVAHYVNTKNAQKIALEMGCATMAYAHVIKTIGQSTVPSQQNASKLARQSAYQILQEAAVNIAKEPA